MYDEFLDFIFPLAKGAGEIQLAYFRGNDLGIETKSNAYDVVTRADKESEAYIVQAILGRYPGHGILGEEGGVMGTAGSDYRWVIDPLDGTTNYSQGLPIFSVSIALQHKGETVAGVVYAPYLGELFWASKGGGAYMKSRSGEVKRLQVSAKQTLATSVLATGFPYDLSLIHIFVGTAPPDTAVLYDRLERLRAPLPARVYGHHVVVAVNRCV